MVSHKQDLISIKKWFGWWEIYADRDLDPNTGAPSIATLSDLETTVEGLCALVDCAKELGQGLGGSTKMGKCSMSIRMRENLYTF